MPRDATPVAVVDPEDLGDLVDNRDDGVQRGTRVLRHERDTTSPEGPTIGLSLRDHVEIADEGRDR